MAAAQMRWPNYAYSFDSHQLLNQESPHNENRRLFNAAAAHHYLRPLATSADNSVGAGTGSAMSEQPEVRTKEVVFRDNNRNELLEQK